MVVAPKKDFLTPKETQGRLSHQKKIQLIQTTNKRFDWVVDDVDNPNVYVLFNDYDFYTELEQIITSERFGEIILQSSHSFLKF